jgi:hypothetical protein
MKTAEDFEFEAMLESVVAERVSIDPPAGLAQRLMARFEQVIEADRIQAARKPFAFAESVKSPRSAASLWLAAGAHAALALTIFGLAEHHIRKVTLKEQMVSTMIEPPLHSTRIDANAARGGGGQPGICLSSQRGRFCRPWRRPLSHLCSPLSRRWSCSLTSE